MTSAKRVPLALHVAILLAAAVPRLWAARFDHGLFWPDEFFQSLEQGHRFAFGYGIVPWEFRDGLRSWLFPGLLGLIMKGGARAGLASGLALVTLVKVVMALGSVWAVDLAMRIGGRLGGRVGGALAGVLLGAFPPAVFFASKCFSETVSVPVVLAAWLLVLPRSSGSRRATLAAYASGFLLALVVFVRVQNALFLVGFGGVLLFERRSSDALRFAFGAVFAAAVGGGLDWLTWGTPFHSLLAYVRFHAAGGAAAWGTEPASYYLSTTWRAAGPAVLVVAVGLAFAAERALRFVALVGASGVVLSFIPHKEYRFFLPVAALALVLAGAGLGGLLEAGPGALRRGRALVAAGVAALAMVGFGERAVRLTFADLGHADGLAAGLAFHGDPVWHAAEGVNLMLAEAGTKRDVCGVVLKDIPWSSTGAFAYLHRDVPLMFRISTETLAAANYLIARREFHQPAPYQMGPEAARFMLFRRDGTCATPPRDTTRRMDP